MDEKYLDAREKAIEVGDELTEMRVDAKWAQGIIHKMRTLPLVSLDALDEFKQKYYPDAEYAVISANSEYNDEGYSARLSFDFFGPGGALDSIKYIRANDDFQYDEDYYNIGNGQEVGQDFHAPGVKYYFSDKTICFHCKFLPPFDVIPG